MNLVPKTHSFKYFFNYYPSTENTMKFIWSLHKPRILLEMSWSWSEEIITTRVSELFHVSTCFETYRYGTKLPASNINETIPPPLLFQTWKIFFQILRPICKINQKEYVAMTTKPGHIYKAARYFQYGWVSITGCVSFLKDDDEDDELSIITSWPGLLRYV